VVPQEDCPLRGLRDRRRLLQDVDDREPVLRPEGHEETRHEGEVEGHVALVAAPVAEVRDGILGPLVGLREEHPVAVLLVHLAPELAQEGVRRSQVLAARPVLLVKIRHGVEPQPVQAEVEPVVDDREHLLPDCRVVEVQVRLVAEEAVPVIGARDGIPRPVGRLGVGEDDPGVGVPVGRVAPDVVLAPRAPGRRAPRALEPRVLVRGVVQHKLADDADPPSVRLGEEVPDVGQGAVVRVDTHVVGRVVAVVASRRGEEGEEPQGGDPEVDEVVELLDQAPEIADPVAVAVAIRADGDLVDDRVLVPVGCGRRPLAAIRGSASHAPSVA
jgi:hypothetical protein